MLRNNLNKFQKIQRTQSFSQAARIQKISGLVRMKNAV